MEILVHQNKQIKENEREQVDQSQAYLIAYRADLDGLRAIAVLGVIFYHAGFTAFKGGFVGVDVFFVLSGYLITTMILKEKQKGEFTIFKFYERRIRRIIPMLFFTISICYIVAYFVCVEKEFIYFAKSAFLASIGLSNFLFAGKNSYFDDESDYMPLVHTWTLGVEEQFYFIVPLIFMVFWRFGKNIVFIVIGMLALGSFGLTFSSFSFNLKFYMLFARFWELAIGSLISFLPSKNYTKTFANIASIVGIFSILFSIFGFDKKMPNPSHFTLLPTMGTALLILYSNNESTITGRILSSKPFVLIGFISYSAYLIHQPAFVFYRLRYINALDLTLPWLLLIVFSLTLSYLTWRFVENPFRRRDSISIRTIIIYILIYFLLTRIDFISILTGKDLAFAPNFKISSQLNIIQTQTIMNKTRNFTRFNSSTSADYVHTKMPDEDQFDFGYDSPVGKACFCHHLYGPKEAKPQLCGIGPENTTNSPVYFLFGDSLAMMMVNLFKEFEQPGIFAGFHGDICSPILRPDLNTTKTISPVANKMGNQEMPCERLVIAVYEYIKNTPSIKRLYLLAQWSPWHEYVSKYFMYNLQMYRSLDVHVYFLEEPPKQPGPWAASAKYKNLLSEGKLTDNNLRKISLTRKAHDEYSKPAKVIFRKFSGERGFTFIPLNDLLCDEEVCSVGTGIQPYFADMRHMNYVGVHRLKQRVQNYMSY